MASWVTLSHQLGRGTGCPKVPASTGKGIKFVYLTHSLDRRRIPHPWGSSFFTSTQLRDSLMCRIGWLFCVLLAFAAFSAAQVTPPPGWTVQNTGGAAVLFSPGEPSSRVAITLLPPGTPIGNVKSWFGNQ